MNKLSDYGQYKHDLFTKLAFNFERDRSILDVGCGDGSDAEILSRYFGLRVSAVDVYKHFRISSISGIEFSLASMFSLPFEAESFDYVFLHDVLHHVDEGRQSSELHLAALVELNRVLRRGGFVVIIESNRFNPISYLHMVKLRGHEHWSQSYFRETVRAVYPEAKFRTFEAHAYPWCLWAWKFYETIIENYLPSSIHSYNVALSKKP